MNAAVPSTQVILNRPILRGVETPTCKMDGIWILEYKDLSTSLVYHIVFEKFRGLCNGDPEWILAWNYISKKPFRFTAGILGVGHLGVSLTNSIGGKEHHWFGTTYTRGWMEAPYARWFYHELVSFNNFKLITSLDMKSKNIVTRTPIGTLPPPFEDYEEIEQNFKNLNYALTA
jgi:hypothetical protein